MLDREPRVERVADHSRAHRRIIELEMMLGVPGERPDPVAMREAERQQGPGQAIAALAKRAIAEPRGNLAGLALHDLGPAMPLGRVVEKLVYRKRVGLHE